MKPERDFKIEIVPAETAAKFTGFFPGLGYTAQFAAFEKKRYGLDSDLLGIYSGGRLDCVFPVNYSASGAYSVYKDYVEPFFPDGYKKINWPAVAKAAGEKFAASSFQFNFGFSGAPDGGLAGFKASELSFFLLKFGEAETRESMFEKFDKKTRNQIRKSESYGFSFRPAGAEAAEIFYQLYRENMDRHGTPAKPFDFFTDLFACYGKKCGLYLAFDGERLAGANLAVVNGRYLKLFFNLSLTEYWDQCVNNFLYFKTIETAYGQGVRLFDFGAGSNRDASHNHFKLGFGAVERPILILKSGSRRRLLRDFIRQKRYNLKIRLNKLRKIL